MKLKTFKNELSEYTEICGDYAIKAFMENEDGINECNNFRLEKCDYSCFSGVEIKCSTNDLGFKQYTLQELVDELTKIIEDDIFVSSGNVMISTNEGGGCDWWIENECIEFDIDNETKTFIIKGSN